jgi:DNA modification methylase
MNIPPRKSNQTPKRSKQNDIPASGELGLTDCKPPFFAEQITQVPINSLKTSNRSLRRHGPAKQKKLEANIRQFGFIVPIVVNEHDRVLAGEARLAAARKLGLQTVPAVVVNHLTPAQTEAFRIADNRLVELSNWDEEALRDTFDTILEIDGDFELELTGFETAEIDGLFEIASTAPEADPDDETPERVSNPAVRRGDLWLIGEHRLLCGDATSADDLALLLDGNQIDLVVTDPPYNVPVNGHVRGTGQVGHREFVLASGELSDDQFEELLSTFLKRSLSHLKQGGLVYSFMDWRSIELLLRCGREADLDLLNIAVWNKTNGGMGSLYRSKHELCAVFKKGTAPHTNNIQLGRHGRYRTNVWDYAGVNSFGNNRSDDLADHPTVKPTTMITDILRDVSKRRAIIFDPFAGSGTVLIAAERAGRVARALELDPVHVETALRRFEKRVGTQAVLADTEETLAQVKARRDAEAQAEADHLTTAPDDNPASELPPARVRVRPRIRHRTRHSDASPSADPTARGAIAQTTSSSAPNPELNTQGVNR